MKEKIKKIMINGTDIAMIIGVYVAYPFFGGKLSTFIYLEITKVFHDFIEQL